MGKRRTWLLPDEEMEDDSASTCVGSSHSKDARMGMVIEECSWDLERELRIEEDRAALPASILLPDLSIAVGHTIGKEVYAHISFRYETASDIFHWNTCEL
jgi:hypothetical protein